MKSKPEAPIDEVIRLLALAAGIAQRKRMAMKLRYRLAFAMMAAYDYAERLRAKSSGRKRR